MFRCDNAAAHPGHTPRARWSIKALGTTEHSCDDCLPVLLAGLPGQPATVLEIP